MHHVVFCSEFLDAEDDVTAFSELLDNLIQQYKQIKTVSAEQQQQQQIIPPAAAHPTITPAAAAAAVPLQVATPRQAPAAAAAPNLQPTNPPQHPAAALPVYPPSTMLTPQGLPILTQQLQQQQQLYHMPHVLPTSAAVAAAAAAPVCAPAAAMFANLGLQYQMVPGLIPPTAAAAVPPGISMQQHLPTAAFAVGKPYEHHQLYHQQQHAGHPAQQNFALPSTTNPAAATAGLGPDTAAAAAAPADSAAAVATKPLAAAAAAPSWLKAWRVTSRRPKYLVGSEPQIKTGQKLPQPGLEPAPECNLCYKEVETLVRHQTLVMCYNRCIACCSLGSNAWPVLACAVMPSGLGSVS